MAQRGLDVAHAGVQLALEVMRAASEAVTKLEGDYAFWMSQFKDQTRTLAARRAAGEGDSALQELQGIKEGITLASRSLSEARQELSSARAELNSARQFFVQVGGTTLASRDEDRLLSRESLTSARSGAMTTGDFELGDDNGFEYDERMALTPSSRQQDSRESRSPKPVTRTPEEVPLERVYETERSMEPEVRQSITSPSQQASTQLEDQTTRRRAKRRRRESIRLSAPPNRVDYDRHFLWQEEGEMHHFPVDVEIPRCPLLEAWHLWCCGDRQLSYPPFRILQNRDMVGSEPKRLFSEYRFTMIWIEEEARSVKAWPSSEDRTIEEATEMLNQVKAAIDAMRNDGGRRKQPVDKLQWTTITALLRKRVKLVEQADATHDVEGQS